MPRPAARSDPRGPKATRPRSSASPAPAARARARSPTSWCGASALDRATRSDRHPLGRPVPAQVRRRAARRPHPDERDRTRACTCARSPPARPEPELSAALRDAIAACRAAGFDLVLVETSGIGQGDTEIMPHADVSLYVMTPEYGAATQLEKIDMLDFADVVAINKFDKRGADALRDVRKQYKRNRSRRSRRGRHPGLRHDRVAVQRRRRDRALPGARRAPRQQRPQARAGTAGARCRPALDGREQHRPPARASATSPRSPKPSREYRRWAGEQSAHRPRAPAAHGGQGDARRRTGPAPAGEARRRDDERRSTPSIAEREAKLDPRARRSSSTCGRRPRRPTAATSTW